MKKIFHHLNTWVFLLLMALRVFIKSFAIPEKRNYHLKNIAWFTGVIIVIGVVDYMRGTYFLEATGITLAIVPLVSIKKTQVCNMAGISTIIYVIPTDAIDTYPTFNAISTPADAVTYVGNYGLKAGKFWHEMYSTKEMGELLGETDGATDGKFFRNKATGFYPRLNADGLGLATILKDTDCIVILKEVSGEGNHFVIGNKDIPVTCSPSYNFGKSYSDEKGITFLFEAANCKPAVIYGGTIITELGAVQAPTTIAVDGTSIDLAVNTRFEVGANTGAIVLNTIENMLPGNQFRIDYVATSTGSLAFTAAFGATVLLDTAGEWFQAKKDENNNIVVVAGSFA